MNGKRNRGRRVGRLLPILVLLAFAAAYFGDRRQTIEPASTDAQVTDQQLAEAFAARRGGVQVEGQGIVERVLPDDNNGSRHQRLVIRLASGQTLLIAHNIDLAPRVDPVAPGDRLRFFGEYEWNPQGGVIHWTHADPAGEHVTGWVEVGGRRYF